MVPSKVFFTKGVGVHKEKLVSFEAALRDAGIQTLNLVTVSSILPPQCQIISREEGLKCLRAGEINFVIMARNETNEPGRKIVASVGLAQPTAGERYGYLSEHHALGESEQHAGDYAEDLAATMLATTLGIEFNPDIGWDERKEHYKMSGQIVQSSNITQFALGDEEGKWKTVLAAAVLIE